MLKDVARGIAGHEDVERRAYDLYEQRGREDGHDWDDWFQAEREVLEVGTANASTVTALPRARRRSADRPVAIAS
jgi:hypothetical protein